MIHPRMIQQLLLNTQLTENELSKKIVIPCFEKMSMLKGYPLQDVRFVGGATELGNDIEYYQIMHPDNYRLYTGVQVKKGDINQSEATALIFQGEQAFGKDILDPSSGQRYRVNRWIVAATGEIKQTSRQLIHSNLSRHGKPISFWDGMKLAEFIQDYFYEEFIQELKPEGSYLQSENIRLNIYDPGNPIILKEEFSAAEWTEIDLSSAVPPDDFIAVYLCFYPTDGSNIPSISIAIRTNEDDMMVDSVMSQVHLIPVRLSPGMRICNVKLLKSDRAVRIACRGYQFAV